MNILIKAPLRGLAGYCVFARNFVLELLKYKNISVYLKPFPWANNTYGGDTKNWKYIYNAIEKEYRFSPKDTYFLHISISKDFDRLEEFKHNLGYTLYDTSSLPEYWVYKANQMDTILVPSQFNYETFRNAGVKKNIEIVPLGVDTNVYNSNYKKFSTVPDKFTFLSIAQINPRKGCELIIKAFLECFGKNKDVQLLLRWYVSNMSDDIKYVKAFVDKIRSQMGIYDINNILLVPKIHESEMPRLYNSAHVYLAPFRGEAWGLPIIEAIACELPVICTNWGGVVEYIKEDCAILLDYQLQRVPYNAVMDATSLSHYWAEPNYEQLKMAMLEVYKNYLFYKAKAIEAREYIINNFQWNHSVEKFVSILKRL